MEWHTLRNPNTLISVAVSANGDFMVRPVLSTGVEIVGWEVVDLRLATTKSFHNIKDAQRWATRPQPEPAWSEPA